MLRSGRRSSPGSALKSEPATCRIVPSGGEHRVELDQGKYERCGIDKNYYVPFAAFR
jgi:hypothetical protein